MQHFVEWCPPQALPPTSFADCALARKKFTEMELPHTVWENLFVCVDRLFTKLDQIVPVGRIEQLVRWKRVHKLTVIQDVWWRGSLEDIWHWRRCGTSDATEQQYRTHECHVHGVSQRQRYRICIGLKKASL